MFSVSSDKQHENEENTLTVNILGKIDCPKVTLCRHIAEDMSKNSQYMIQFNFLIEFETQFEILREKLLKEDLNFLRLQESPIIYSQEKSKLNKKEIIGSLEDFLRWLIQNYEYYAETDYKTIAEVTRENLKNLIAKTDNKYCYFDISIEGVMQEKVVFELFSGKCPQACNHFISLCKGVKISNSEENISYKNTFIHRIVKDGYIQGGDFNNYKKEDLLKALKKEEFNDEHYGDFDSSPGIIRMIKTGYTLHSNESQFYITLTGRNSFNRKYVTVGRIVQGFKTIKQIEAVETYLQKPRTIVKVEKSGEYII